MAQMKELFDIFGDMLKSVLPLSPFRQYLEEFSGLPYLGWINWFVPIGDAVSVLGVWVAAIAVFYIYSIILRWVKVIQ